MVQLAELQWAAVRVTLPAGVDEAWFRSELERIASDMVPPSYASRCILSVRRSVGI